MVASQNKQAKKEGTVNWEHQGLHGNSSRDMEGLEGLPNWKVARGAHEHEYIQPTPAFPFENGSCICRYVWHSGLGVCA